jgi:hypothetical protein
MTEAFNMAAGNRQCRIFKASSIAGINMEEPKSS